MIDRGDIIIQVPSIMPNRGKKLYRAFFKGKNGEGYFTQPLASMFSLKETVDMALAEVIKKYGENVEAIDKIPSEYQDVLIFYRDYA